MLKSLLKFLAPPVFPDDEDKTRKARYANVITIVLGLAALGFETATRIVRGYTDFRVLDFVMLALVVAMSLGLVMLRRGYVNLTSSMLVVVLWATSNALAASGFGIRDTSFIINFPIILMAGLLLGWQAAGAMTILTILSGFSLAIAEQQGLIRSPSYSVISFAADMMYVFGVNAVLIYLLITGLENEIKRSKASFKELERVNLNLNQAQADLQKRNAELIQRGLELEIANEQVRRRAAQFEALSQVSHAITGIRELETLLPTIANAISERFGFYHVGIFMLDEAGEYAVLLAANSEGGKRMLERKHRLRVGEQGIVGAVAASGLPRIALDVGKDAVFFNNPDLPETRSEMALPLKRGERIIGVLDIQSKEKNAFTEQDVQTLSLLAEQVSLAIENARLFDENRRALAEYETISRKSTREAWARLPKRLNIIGYHYKPGVVSPLRSPIELTESVAGNGAGSQTETNQVVVPIELRGERIGTLVVQSPVGQRWDADQLDLIKAVAERVALSAENARLFEETTARAEREQLVSEITGKIRSHNDPQAMIQTAINELRKALGATRVEIIPQTVRGNDQHKA